MLVPTQNAGHLCCARPTICARLIPTIYYIYTIPARKSGDVTLFMRISKNIADKVWKQKEKQEPWGYKGYNL